MNLFPPHEWLITETDFNADRHQIAESIFSIGNGAMGQRANFEEQYSGKSLRGNYIGGVFFPDKTRVGWWKNGYPDYFAKVLNAPAWIGVNVWVNNQALDLAQCEILSFYRQLDMQQGILSRAVQVKMPDGVEVTFETERFVSVVDTEVGALRFVLRANKNCTIRIESTINSDVHNEDSNYNESFWDSIAQNIDGRFVYAIDKTKKTPYDVPQFSLATAICTTFFAENKSIKTHRVCENKLLSEIVEIELQAQQLLLIEKLACQISTLNYAEQELAQTVEIRLSEAVQKGFTQLKQEHIQAWAEKWKTSDICIEGDVEAQQGIRFNIFHLHQTYSGNDSRLNIGPKGFTGEKYGGSTYWDTEAFCLPFYLSTSPEHVAKQLLTYRYKQLDRAIANAEKLGFSGGAALFPMVTMTGDECHNEWEITFEEIHRNGAIAYAVYNYVNYTGDKSYLMEGGLELLIAISRFWAQRVNLSPMKRKYMILGVTGPNEYENNVHNNWYTNYFARWCLQYTLETISWAKRVAKQEFAELCKKIAFDENFEVLRWTDITKNMYLPEDENYGIILQNDGYLDKEQKNVAELDAKQRPINQHWSWDRILRSCYIKQADVVQGLYVFENDFDMEHIERNFNFYEARCVHESSLSPCIHSVVASKIGNVAKAYELYLRTARLDLDDYNKEAHEGLHITSMAGTWLAIVQGFAGMRTKSHTVSFAPQLPKEWAKLSFSILYRGALLHICMTSAAIEISLEEGELREVVVNEEYYSLQEGKVRVSL
ncbi:MAG: family 65 glycosyl hydrolase domain-containing protein [Bacteroidetes bacterium]|nr:family 65 glycosyl hydrolase domain-containing protein [Bacteroidota bacterium]